MERLADAEEDKIGYIHDIVDGTLTRCREEILQPLGRFMNLDAADGHA